MATDRRQLLLLAVLIVGIAVVFAWRQASDTTAAGSSTSNTRGRGRAAAAAPVTAPDVRLEALDVEHPKPDGVGRNLFRFRAAPVERPAPAPSRPSPTPAARPDPAVPPGIAPISLKFVGFLATEDGEKIASLSDGRGAPFLGKEGTIVLGRYKIWKIGEESIELSYADGTGRTIIRLTGQ